MRNSTSVRLPSGLLLTGLLALAGAGCSNGGTIDTGDISIRCINGDAFCVISCDLGCGQTGCSVTEIAENQRLRFVFSNRIDPASVNGASVSIRTPTGVAPDGDLMVNNRELTFVPRVRTVNGVSTFGFQRNESYIITLNNEASGQGVRSTSGHGLKKQLSCTVLVSRGIQDEDQLPPTAELISPTITVGIPLQPTVVLRFSELIDTTALLGPLSSSSPVQFLLKGTTSTPGGLVCDSLQTGTFLEGIPSLSTERVGDREVTVLTYTAPLQLPGSACLTVNVTADVRDLSGRQGVPATFELVTTGGVSQQLTLAETFASSAFQDLAVSSSVWNAGARPGLIGSDGRHGSFDVTLGTNLGGGVYEWNTDSFVIPASRSLTGLDYLVTDGKFYFSDFVLPAGTTLRFSNAQSTSPSTVPPQIWVRGSANILGSIDVSAPSMPFYVPGSGLAAGQNVSNFNAIGATTATFNYVAGQPGGAGGVGGGRGGKGGDECQLNGDVTQTIGLEVVHIYYGRNGEDVRLPAGHAFAAMTGGTGGKGSLLQPLTGMESAVFAELIGFLYRSKFAPGGGGGGFSGPGSIATANIFAPIEAGVAQPGGVAFGLPLPTPLPSGFTSLNHFVAGGSGGGGGGSHAYGTRTGQGSYVAGSGGSGGGGALALRVGGDLNIAAGAALRATGGPGVLITGDDPNFTGPDANWGVSSPGGGGSGGSFLLQAGRNVTIGGQLDLAGGAGSRTGSISILQSGVPPAPVPAPFNITSQGGAGAPGFFRLESGAGSPVFTGTSVPTYNAAIHAGPLTDRDPLSGGMSKWRGSGPNFPSQFFPPQWQRYELDVDLDGDGTVDIVYTDSGLPGTMMANDPNGPVQILFQGAVLNQAGDAPLPGEVKPWRYGIGSGGGPGIFLDSVTGFRFQLLFNRAAGANTVVRGLRVYAQT
jgi:hypothetical protein